ncbi:hypothetical protein QFC21_002754 [Naganishia friedmannii]|uniref:Uncharacterized protein n=1 Tax=Naganishia friedmannii TaxID=89922 RepID=A0ACC2VSF1_9TREE|nr:hypothetical protein QFC21_002754 [Naganishia friedmannii]
MPEEQGQGSSRGGKTRAKEKDRGSRDPSYGDYKDDIMGLTSGTGTGNASEGKGGSGINRVNRQDCVMEKPTKGTSSLADVGDDRIKHLESQVTSIQNTLADLVSTIKAGVGLGSSGLHSSMSPSVRQGFDHDPSPLPNANAYISPASSGAYGYASTSYHNIPSGPIGTIPGYSTLQNYPLPHQIRGESGTIDSSYSTSRQEISGGPHLAHGGSASGGMAGGRPSGGIPNGPGAPMRASSLSSTSSGHGLSHGAGNQAFNISNTRGSNANAVHLHRSSQNAYPHPEQSSSRLDAILMNSGPDLKDSFAWSLNNVNNQSSVPGAYIRAREGFPTNPSPDALPLHPQPPATPGGAKPKSGSGVNTANRSGGGTTPSGSDVDEEADSLAAASIMDPLGSMSSMAGLAEAAVERARAEKLLMLSHHRQDGDAARRGSDILSMGREGDSHEADVKALDFGAKPSDHVDSDQPRKRRRLDSSTGPTEGKSFAIPIDPALMQPPTPLGSNNSYQYQGPENIPRGVIESRRYGKGKQQVKSHVHAFPDIVDLGLVSETEARELFDLFFSGSSNFLPVYDSTYDTWDDLRMRSPFSISAIVAVGARVRDGGGPMSSTQRIALDHSRKIALGTMFTPVTRIEAVQSMIVLAAFSDQGWLPTGHAVRMALDMELNHCFMKLLRDNMGQGKTPDQLDSDRDLVVGARVWFCLYMIEHQMSYGTGRPAILREDESIAQCRRFLEHPLSIISDVRLISTVECIALRAPLHVLLTSSPEDPVDQMTVARLQQANYDLDRWQNYWDRVLAERFNKDEGDFFRESLAAQREYSSLFINSQLLRGVKEAADVRKMPQDKRDLAIRAMRNAQTCLDIAIRGKNYRSGLRFAVHYTHVCAAFAASFLIRIARLFPRELDLKKTAKDVEELASVLEKVPAGRYARSLRLILRRARKQKFIPPPSMPGSPNKFHMPIGSSGLRPLSTIPKPAYGNNGPTNATSILHSTLMPNAGLAPPSVQQPSPGNSLSGTLGTGRNESPQSNPESYEYDWNFAQELLNRADIDMRINTLGNGVHYNDPNFLQGVPSDQTYELPPDMWW